MHNYNLIIFDLDGTLLDTSEGIFNSVRYAEKKMGLLPVSAEKLSLFAGPPPTAMYKKVYGLDDTAARKAAFYHREYSIEKAVYQAVPYIGMDILLTRLREKGCQLAVATLKRQDVAEKILGICGFRQYFNLIAGMDGQENFTKALIIETIVEKLGTKKSALMIGDTVFDETGAKEAGIDFLGVSYGFGFSEDEKFCRDPLDIWKRIGE